MKHVEIAAAPGGSDLWHLRALNEATARVRNLQTDLEEAERQMRVFRTDHMILVAGRLAFRCSDITGRADLDVKWHGLVTRRDGLLRDWNQALAAYAELKTT